MPASDPRSGHARLLHRSGSLARTRGLDGSGPFRQNKLGKLGRLGLSDLERRGSDDTGSFGSSWAITQFGCTLADYLVGSSIRVSRGHAGGSCA
jgi:hypothetical protein